MAGELISYKLVFAQDFQKDYKKVIGKDATLVKKFLKTVDNLQTNPFLSSLRTHKVDTKKYDGVYSSWVTGDIRIIWQLDENKNTIIIALQLGTHSGASQVYKNKSS